MVIDVEVLSMDLNNPAHPGHSNYLISSEGRTAEQIFYPRIPLLESVRSDLLDLAYTGKIEDCGFITANFDIVLVKNSHLEPRTNFYMNEENAGKAIDTIYKKLHSEILGIWHTHPNGYPWPSPRDLIGWPNAALGWRYFLVTRGDVTEWRLLGG